jgi:transposase
MADQPGPTCIAAGLLVSFEQAVHHIVLEDFIAAVETTETRRDRLTAQIEAMLPDWTLAPVVSALQTMRGMALVNAATLIAELGDLSRFANPRQLMAYLGVGAIRTFQWCQQQSPTPQQCDGYHLHLPFAPDPV